MPQRFRPSVEPPGVRRPIPFAFPVHTVIIPYREGKEKVQFPGSAGVSNGANQAIFPAMPKYVIAFMTPKSVMVQKSVELDSQEAAMRFFFKNYITEGYSQDEEGFCYFKDDFNDPENP